MEITALDALGNAFLFEKHGCFDCTFGVERFDKRWFCALKNGKHKYVAKDFKCENWRKNRLQR